MEGMHCLVTHHSQLEGKGTVWALRLRIPRDLDQQSSNFKLRCHFKMTLLGSKKLVTHLERRALEAICKRKRKMQIQTIW